MVDFFESKENYFYISRQVEGCKIRERQNGHTVLTSDTHFSDAKLYIFEVNLQHGSSGGSKVALS